MNKNYPWLPDLIDYTKFKNNNDFIIFLYSVFKRDIKDNPPFFENKLIKSANKILDCSSFSNQGNCGNLEYNCENCSFKGKEDIFNHLTCCDNLNQRVPGSFDLSRALRIGWIKPIIENYTKAEVLYFEEPYKNKGLTIYFWVKAEKYIVIIRKTKSDKLFLTTAFYINKSSNYARNMEKKYNTYNAKKTPTASL